MLTPSKYQALENKYSFQSYYNFFHSKNIMTLILNSEVELRAPGENSIGHLSSFSLEDKIKFP